MTEPIVRPTGASVFSRSIPGSNVAVDGTRDVDVPDDQLTTTLATLTYRSSSGRFAWPRPFLEAIGFTVLGLAFGHAVGAGSAGVVSLFLASAALSSRFKQILRARRRSSALRLLAGVVPLGLGMFVAYSAVAVALGPEGVRERFEFAIQATGVGADRLDAQRFRASWGLLGHNLLVLLSAFLLAFVYRGFGALLTLGWNAASWAVALALLVQPGADWPRAVLAIFPHLGLEGLGYMAAALAGIRAGTHVAGGRSLGPGWALAGIGLTLVGLGWVVEGLWPGWVLSGSA